MSPVSRARRFPGAHYQRYFGANDGDCPGENADHRTPTSTSEGQLMALVSFDDAIALHPLGDGRYTACPPRSWAVASGRTAGGLMAAQLLAGATAVVDDPERPPLSFTAHLLRAPAEGEFEVHAEVLRTGRSIINATAQVTQDGKLIATALASFATSRPSPEFDELPMPEVEPPTPGRVSEAFIPDFVYPYGDNIVLQERTGQPALSGSAGPMERIGWAGFARPRPVDAPGLVMVGDIGMMPWWMRLDELYVSATLDHTVHFRADLRAVEADLVLVRSRTGLVREGYLDWDMDVWAPDGTLLCQSRQLLAVLGPVEEK